MNDWNRKVKRLLFRYLSFKQYLLILSRMYFISYRLGILKRDPHYSYHYFLHKIIKEGDTVIDIGANLGYFTKLFSKWVGPEGMVHAVEPVVPVREVLLKNIRHCKNVIVHPFALGNENKTIELGNLSKSIYGYMTSGTHFVLEEETVLPFPVTHRFRAEMRRPAELFKDEKRLDFIKCDTEGYEIVIIPEMKELINKFLPTMLIETRRESRKKIIEFLTEFGYSGFVLLNGKLSNAITIPDNQDDILFVHASQNHLVAEFVWEKEGILNLHPSGGM